MHINSFLEMLSKGDGTHQFGDWYMRFITTLTHPNYSAFNQKTREVVFFEQLNELLSFKIDNKTVKEYIQKYKKQIIIFKTWENNSKKEQIPLIERWAEDKNPVCVLQAAINEATEKFIEDCGGIQPITPMQKIDKCKRSIIEKLKDPELTLSDKNKLLDELYEKVAFK